MVRRSKQSEESSHLDYRPPTMSNMVLDVRRIVHDAVSVSECQPFGNLSVRNSVVDLIYNCRRRVT